MHVLIISAQWVEPNSTAAGGRMLQLIRCFLSEGFKITYASTGSTSVFAVDLKALNVDELFIKSNDSEFDQVLIRINPSAVIFDRFIMEEQFGWRVVQCCPKALRVLDTEDLHFLRAARQEALGNGEITIQLESEAAIREIAAIYRCDLSLIISTAEVELLQQHFHIDPAILLYLPFMHEPIQASDCAAWPSFEERTEFVVIGNFLHAPNLDAVIYLKNAIWPLIRAKMNDAVLNVYGAYPNQKVLAMNDVANGFIMHGRAEQAHAVIKKAKIMLAPLRFGAGLKGKLFDAMLCGTPSIATSIGAEGIAGSDQWPGVVTNDPDLFAEAAVNLSLDQQRWKTCQEIGISVINDNFNLAFHLPRLIERIVSVQSNLVAHRQQNFIGKMLMHQSMRSTEFMSRWIEAKNKK